MCLYIIVVLCIVYYAGGFERYNVFKKKKTKRNRKVTSLNNKIKLYKLKFDRVIRT